MSALNSGLGIRYTELPRRMDGWVDDDDPFDCFWETVEVGRVSKLKKAAEVVDVRCYPPFQVLC